jgi:hypothetical protein
MKDKIKAILSNVQRAGIKDLEKFLEENDFYTAPCSTKFHLACEGGLAQHTLNVVQCALETNACYKLYQEESVIIAAFGHDLCKMNSYKLNEEKPTDPQMYRLRQECTKHKHQLPPKLTKNYASDLIGWYVSECKGSRPEYKDTFVVDDQLPLGHGEKSLYIMQQFITLTLDEALAIRWHMAAFDAGIHFNFPSGYAYRAAIENSKLVSIIILADIEASNLMEV